MSSLRADIAALLNSRSAENRSNTPDFILAEYLISCLAAFDQATNAREEFYGRQGKPRTGDLRLVPATADPSGIDLPDQG